MVKTGIAGLVVGLVWLFIGSATADAQCPHIGYLTCDSQGSSVALSWNPPANNFSQITVLRNEQAVAQINGQLTSFIDTPPPGVHTYRLTSNCGTSSYSSQGQVGVLATFSADHVSAVPGGTADTIVRVSSQNCNGVTSASFGLCHDPSMLAVIDLQVTGSLAALNFSNGPGLQFLNMNPTSPPGMAGLTFGFIADISPPLDQYVPAAIGSEILTVSYSVSPNAPEGSSCPLEFTGELGAPVVPVRIGVDGLELLPTMTPESGSVTVQSATGDLFVRGDVNVDGIVALIDGISLLSYLFLNQSINCEISADFTDDGAVNLLDGINLLSFLFILGSDSPAQPFPNCGFDSSPGQLGCSLSTSCQ